MFLVREQTYFHRTQAELRGITTLGLPASRRPAAWSFDVDISPEVPGGFLP